MNDNAQFVIIGWMGECFVCLYEIKSVLIKSVTIRKDTLKVTNTEQLGFVCKGNNILWLPHLLFLITNPSTSFRNLEMQDI